MRSNSIRTTVLAATALLAALSLTACGSSDNGGTSDNGKARSGAPAANSAAEQTRSSIATQTKVTTDAAAGTRTDAGAGTKALAHPAANTARHSTGSTPRASKKSSLEPVVCTGDNTKTTVSKVNRPVNHLLLTLTNTGDRPCYAYHAPKLRFDDAQAVFRILDESRPQAVVTLNPGESSYAAIGLSGEGDENNLHPSKHLQVNFSSRSFEGSTGTPANVTLPANTYWGDNGFVTYWQFEMADALAY
ncbi:DUF4232 domain-containing protein [Streptomyces sp. NPDC058382]|uniref:DUF4232 domain-containing protein n=1 Tax=unclassified Streptomyces TaxID=2593676 RepID=UPI00363E347A